MTRLQAILAIACIGATTAISSPAEASITRGLSRPAFSIKASTDPDPFAAAPQLVLPSLTQEVRAIEERQAAATECVALCDLAASVEAHPLGVASAELPNRSEDAWGNYRFTSELTTSHNRFGFTGHYWDKEASLYYAKARYYDPFTARFTQADAFLGTIDDPPSLHRYQYANANPTLYTDPTGNESVLPYLAERDKVGDIAMFKQDVFKKDPARFSDALADDEISYLKELKGTQFESGRLNETQITEARSLFGDGDDALQRYANYANRGQLITRHAFADPTMQAYVKELYRTTRDLNIAQFGLERGYQIGAGEEMFTGDATSRGTAALELSAAMLGIKATQTALAAIRPPTSGGGVSPAEIEQAEARARAIVQPRSPRGPLGPNQKGDLAKSWSRDAALARGERIIGEEVDLIFTINGKKVAVRADVLSRSQGSNVHVYIESKYSGRAPYTDHQKIVIPDLVRSGDAGLVAEIGSRSGALRPGQRIRVVFQGDVWGAKPTLLGH